MTKPPAYHYSLLNEIHANRAARKVVAPHYFSNRELDEISLSVGDGIALGQLNYSRGEQPRLIAATIAAMTDAYPYLEQDED